MELLFHILDRYVYMVIFILFWLTLILEKLFVVGHDISDFYAFNKVWQILNEERESCLP